MPFFALLLSAALVQEPAKTQEAPKPVQTSEAHTPSHTPTLPKSSPKKTKTKTTHVDSAEEAEKHMKHRTPEPKGAPEAKKPYLKKHTGHGGAPAPKPKPAPHPAEPHPAK